MYNYAYPNSYNPYAQRTNYGDNNTPVIKGRPVSSFEEARVSMIDFDGSVFYFPDLANQKIYTKQINLDGTSSIKVYELVVPATPPPVPEVELVTKEEFNKTVETLVEQIDKLRQATTNKVAVAQAPVSQQDFKF